MLFHNQERVFGGKGCRPVRQAASALAVSLYGRVVCLSFIENTILLIAVCVEASFINSSAWAGDKKSRDGRIGPIAGWFPADKFDWSLGRC
jgi:hypothetical protein